MTDLPPMVPSAEERARDLWIRFAGRWADDKHVTENCLSRAYHDGQQSRQPEIDHFKFNLERVQQHLQHTIAERDALRAALDESVKLQSHYADLLNMYDDGQRIIFKSSKEWLERFATLESKGNPNAPKT